MGSGVSRRYGIDIFMSTTILKASLRIVEVELPPKVHKPSLPKRRGGRGVTPLDLVFLFFFRVFNIKPTKRFAEGSSASKMPFSGTRHAFRG